MLTLITHHSPVSLHKAGRASLITNNKGMALVLTLMVLALITALVVEFSYAVYTNTNALYNWKTSQRLSFVAKSGVQLASKAILEEIRQHPSYTYPGSLDIPVKNPFEDFKGTVLLRIEDENSKFNINSLQIVRDDWYYNSFLRLLRALDIDPGIANRIADWIDADSDPRLSDSEKGAKNKPLDSINELLLIPGIDKKSYDKLLPYITIYGDKSININGAEIPVLMSLSDSIDKNMAERIVAYRKISPFNSGADIQSVAGITLPIYSQFGARITAKGTHFRIISTATEEGIKKIIESVLEISSLNATVRYWKEM
ncbi:MAG: type II secretion system minor pseudopilin GspK [Nitrospirae bacterium]|nr:type II secretion system minor pseudopilin GspK [Nitrospirota bacterium]